MLEQAIVDAAALREAALKNAEQAIIEKYAPQIKEAIDSLLDDPMGDPMNEPDGDEEVEELAPPMAASPMDIEDEPVNFKTTADAEVFEFDLDKIQSELEAAGADEAGLGGDELGAGGEEMGGDELGGDEELDLDLGGDEGELALQEVFRILEDLNEEDEEEEVLNEEEEDEEVEADESLMEELIVDMSGDDKGGWFETNKGELNYRQEMQLAKEESDELKEENEELQKRLKKMSESIKSLKNNEEKMITIIKKLDNSLNETLLSNAKLLYSNHTLSDASLNERQKNKIVEAIAKAQTPEEARNLHEALKTTVGTVKKDGPKSLRESVSRKSNLSGIMPRRKQPEQEFSFADQMKKLAGIK